MAMIGMDLDVVSGAAGKLRAQAGSLDNMVGRVNGLVTSASRAWLGADSKAFAVEWQNSARAQATSAADLLREMAATLERNVSEQRRASDAGGHRRV